jgi:hypothetical protein
MLYTINVISDVKDIIKSFILLLVLLFILYYLNVVVFSMYRNKNSKK